jgi:phosphohistidine phosphatase SixA
VTVYLVRHAKAGDRARWDGADPLRPLSKRGRRQADALAEVLSDAPVDRVVSSPYVRCRESVDPLAQRRGLEVEVADELAEGTPLPEVLALIDKFAHEDVVLCTHGDVVGDLLDHLASRGVPLGDTIKLEKGSTWVLGIEAGEITGGRYLPPPK